MKACDPVFWKKLVKSLFLTGDGQEGAGKQTRRVFLLPTIQTRQSPRATINFSLVIQHTDAL